MKLFPILIICRALAAIATAEDLSITRADSVTPQPGPAENFTGSVRVERLFADAGPSGTSGGLVTFDAGARTAWHTHPAGQTLIVTAGKGRVQREGGPVEEIRKGDVVSIPAGVKHWHGASPDSPMAHLAITGVLDGSAVAWREKVSDADFSAPVKGAAAAPAEAGPSRAQQLVGDVAPKLAELTDEVLFGDVWARPELARRDRSLITVSALIAMNRPEQLRSHLALAQQNGVTRKELSEVITHLAFYTGWPNAMSAAAVAKEVFKD
jgi:4-carboxymuconolactone decarboxylase